jgi:hypothetical protein
MARKTYGEFQEESTDKTLTETQSAPIKIKTISASKLLNKVKAEITNNLSEIKQTAVSTLDSNKRNVSESLEEHKKKNSDFLTNIK